MVKVANEMNSAADAPAHAGLPAWEQIPDIELYMDQVIALMTRYLGPTAEDGSKILTASMVNNYVKTGLVPAPAKKRYTREHLAYLAIICLLKAVLPLSAIRTLLERELAERSIAEFYAEFRASVVAAEEAARADYESGPSPALRAALRARAERELAVAFYS